MKKIHVIAMPSGFAHEHIREQFVGLKILLASEEELAANPPSPLISSVGEEPDGYIVRRSDAIEALRAAGRTGAADFWRRIGMGHYLLFKKEVCELIESNSTENGGVP